MGANFGEAEFVGFAAGLDGEFEGDGHSNWIRGDGDGGVDKHGVGTEFHGFGSVAGGTESGIDDDGAMACSMMMRIWSRVTTPRFEPMGAPNGMTVAVPTSCRRLARTGSALM